MIYYFSGTRNSRYSALRIASDTGESAGFIPALNPYEVSFDSNREKSVGFVFPVYAWGVPPIVLDFIAGLPESYLTQLRDRDIPVWCAATCGDETGKAIEMLRKALSRRGISLKGAWSIIMPNVYVLLPGFGTDSRETEQKKLSESIVRLAHISEKINSREWEKDVHEGGMSILKTALVYPLFRKWGVNPKKWHFTDGCIGCGKCAKACPVGNIAMTDGHPKWGSDCTSCCACYHVCPTRSAQYGKITANMGQYYLEKC